MGLFKSKPVAPVVVEEPEIEVETLDIASVGPDPKLKIREQAKEIAVLKTKIILLEQQLAELNERNGFLLETIKESGDWRLSTSAMPDKMRYFFTLKEGEYKFREGRYFGQLWNGVPNGEGKTTYGSGNEYTGQYYRGKRNGLGKYLYVSGDYFEGEFRDGLKVHWGRYVWKDGDEYEGCFADDKIEGFGIKKYKDGRKYLGMWRDGKWNGPGIELSKNQLMVTVGNWAAGEFSGEVREYYLKDALLYEEGKLLQKLARSPKNADENHASPKAA